METMDGAADSAGLLIFPCNGNAVEALDCLGERDRLIGFVDDLVEKQGTTVCGFPVYDRLAIENWADGRVLAVPGSPASFRQRKHIISGLGVSEDRFATVIHRNASVSPYAKIGRNVLIMAGVVVTSNAEIGDHVCILPNSVVHHDAIIGAWTLIGSNVTIAGGSVVGENCYIGSGTSIMNGLRIGGAALLGLGSTVIRDVPANVTYAGTPARELKSFDGPLT